jgi:cyclic pyranopterin monophosphate synthase
MVDITAKSNTLRVATALAIVKVSEQATIDAIHNNTVPKGDVFSMSRAAGLLGVKKTPELLPDCHPMPIEYTGIDYEVNGLEISILVTVKTIYKTGVEVEAMHGASIVALNIYDMLKPLDKGVEIAGIRLLSKKGGKSDFTDKFKDTIRAAVVVCSDSVASGKKQDKAGATIADKLVKMNAEIANQEVIPDEPEVIGATLKKYAEQQLDLIIFTGGTGLSPRDVTPESLRPLLDREIPGIAEAMRSYGQDRTPYSMLSRSLAGVKDQSLVLALPGSTNGAAESMDALFPPLLHVFRVFQGIRHDS